jgi:hypothetical protein
VLLLLLLLLLPLPLPPLLPALPLLLLGSSLWHPVALQLLLHSQCCFNRHLAA